MSLPPCRRRYAIHRARRRPSPGPASARASDRHHGRSSRSARARPAAESGGQVGNPHPVRELEAIEGPCADAFDEDLEEAAVAPLHRDRRASGFEREAHALLRRGPEFESGCRPLRTKGRVSNVVRSHPCAPFAMRISNGRQTVECGKGSAPRSELGGTDWADFAKIRRACRTAGATAANWKMRPSAVRAGSRPRSGASSRPANGRRPELGRDG